jgi:hypothetical protein
VTALRRAAGPSAKGWTVLNWFPRWVFVSLTMAGVLFAVAVGYQHDSHRLRAAQDRGMGQLSGALKAALESTLALQRRSVRPPRAAQGGDTLEFALARPVVLSPHTDPAGLDLYYDSLCRERLPDPRSREGIVRLGQVPARVWALDRVRIFVDKVRGGLWQVTGEGEPEILAAPVESFAIEVDAAGTDRRGMLLELVGSWSVDPSTSIRRRLYRYLPSAETTNG